MLRISRRQVVYWLIFLLLAFGPGFTQAALVPCQGTVEDPCTFNHLLKLLQNIYNYLLGLAGLVALLFIVWAGIKMSLFYLSEHPESDLQNAKYTLTRAIFGLVLIICAYLIVNTAIRLIGGGSITDIFNRAGF